MDKAVAGFEQIVGKQFVFVTEDEMAQCCKVMMATKIEEVMPKIS